MNMIEEYDVDVALVGWLKRSHVLRALHPIQLSEYLVPKYVCVPVKGPARAQAGLLD